MSDGKNHVENPDSSGADGLEQLLAVAIGTLETKLMDYLKTNVSPLVDRVQQLEVSNKPEAKDGTKVSVEKRLEQLEGELAAKQAAEKQAAVEASLRGAIDKALDGTALDEPEFVKNILFSQLANTAEDTSTGWLTKDGVTVSEFVTDFLQKPVGKRFIRVTPATGSGTPEPKSLPPLSQESSSITSIVANTNW